MDKITTRNTSQKQLVMACIQNNYNHPSIDDIFALCRKTNPSISKATVYRIVNSLVDDKKVLSISLPNNMNRFDFNNHVHAHFFCTKCNSLKDYDLDLQITNNELENDEVHSVEILYKGICSKCKNS